MAAGVRKDGPIIAGRVWLTAMIGVAGLMVLGATACSSNEPRTEVRGEVLTRDDASLGGPDAALAEFRAGERAVYGTGVAGR